MAKAAVVLCGCGYLDGSEITEAVSVLLHLTRHGVEYHCFAPNADQPQIVDHLTGAESDERRNMLHEAARIARGRANVSPLSELNADEYDLLAIPGGFGAAKNLSDFASKGADMTILPDLERAVRAFHEAGKPVAACCIAPPIVAKALGTKAGGPGVTVTVGEDGDPAEAIAAFGSRHEAHPVTEAAIDERAKVATAPAYMYGDATPWEVFTGIGQMIDAAVEMAGVKTGASAL